MKNKVYIMGGAQTDFERNWTKEGKTFIAMLRRPWKTVSRMQASRWTRWFA